MSNPSFSNIDLWLFELAEGNLTPAQVEQLELFLLQHPELDVERDVWEMARVQPKEMVYPNQVALTQRNPGAWYAVGATTVAVLALLIWSSVADMTSTTSSNGMLAELSAAGQGASSTGNTEEVPSVIQTTGPEIQLSGNQLASNGAANNSTATTNINGPSHGSTTTNTFVSNGVQSQGNGVLTTGNSIANEPTFGSTNGNGQRSLLNNAQFGNVQPLAVQGMSSIDIDRDFALAPYVVQPIPSTDENDYALNESDKRNGGAYGMSSSEYHLSFKARMNRLARKIQRMFDNPVALKNFRDPHYHVPGMLPNDINISSTGTMLAPRVQTNTRLQWLGQENEQLINQIAVDGYAYSVRGGIGIQINHGMYKDGAMNVASAAITYSPKISITKGISLEPSVRFKLGNSSFAHSKMGGVDQVELERGNSHAFYPEGTTPTGNDLWFHDLGAGLMVNTEWFFIGAQVDNLFRHRDNIYANDVDSPRRADYHFIATLGTDWVSRKENLGLSPYLVYQKNERLSEAWLGANFRWHWFTVGAAVSSNIEPAASIGLKFEHFALNYNADYVESDMTGKKALSHQLTLRFVGKPSRFGKRLLNL